MVPQIPFSNAQQRLIIHAFFLKGAARRVHDLHLPFLARDAVLPEDQICGMRIA